MFITLSVVVIFTFFLHNHVLCSTPSLVAHIPIKRRGGSFYSTIQTADSGLANLTRLAYVLEKVESRYARTYRDTEGNQVVRRWHACEHGKVQGDTLFQEDVIGREGGWYTELEVGEPKQALQVDIDMLSPDFFTVTTTSPHGSKYDTFLSSSFVSSDTRAHPQCIQAREDVYVQPGKSSSLYFPVCNPAKSSRQTLAISGTLLGLSPSGPLSRLNTPTFIDQLVQNGIIAHRVWSLTLLDSSSGVLSLGGTIAKHVERTKIETEVRLSHLDDDGNDESDSKDTEVKIEHEITNRMNFAIPPFSTHEEHFKWTESPGATSRGHWTALMAGVWVDGEKILKNQPVIFDVNCPFILAPKQAARRFYAAIGGMPLSEFLFAFASASARTPTRTPTPMPTSASTSTSIFVPAAETDTSRAPISNSSFAPSDRSSADIAARHLHVPRMSYQGREESDGSQTRVPSRTEVRDGILNTNAKVNINSSDDNGSDSTESYAEQIRSSSRFYVYPCLNAVHVSLELAGWPFPVMGAQLSSTDEYLSRAMPVGGWLSLGKPRPGTGYCVGRVVERRGKDGQQEEEGGGGGGGGGGGRRRKEQKSSGMHDFWVLGEPAFRGLGIAFDLGTADGAKNARIKARIGVRNY